MKCTRNAEAQRFPRNVFTQRLLRSVVYAAFSTRRFMRCAFGRHLFNASFFEVRACGGVGAMGGVDKARARRSLRSVFYAAFCA